MGKVFDAIPEEMAAWILRQPLFFIGSAPLAGDGHVNISPKGLDTFRVLGPRRVGYLDLTGSGAETIAHLRENGRVVLMFCAFAGPPKIVRLHGRGSVVMPGSDRWETLRGLFPGNLGERSIVEVEVTRVSSSCGFGIPVFGKANPRDTLDRWAAAKGVEGLETYRRTKSAKSIDGLPAVG